MYLQLLLKKQELYIRSPYSSSTSSSSSPAGLAAPSCTRRVKLTGTDDERAGKQASGGVLVVRGTGISGLSWVAVCYVVLFLVVVLTWRL